MSRAEARREEPCEVAGGRQGHGANSLILRSHLDQGVDHKAARSPLGARARNHPFEELREHGPDGPGSIQEAAELVERALAIPLERRGKQQLLVPVGGVEASPANAQLGREIAERRGAESRGAAELDRLVEHLGCIELFVAGHANNGIIAP